MDGMELIPAMTQFGTAGLIGAMWLVERRLGAERERQLSEAHRRLIDERRESDRLFELLSGTARALAALETTQRELIRVISFQRAGGSARATDDLSSPRQ